MKPEAEVSPPMLIGDDGEMKSNQDSVTYLNDYFAGIGEKLDEDLTLSGHPPKQFVFTEPVQRYPKIKVHLEEIRFMVEEINVNKTSGIPSIRCDILKLAMQNLLPQLTWLYQLSFDEGIFPTSWKLARVHPIPKLGNERLVSNWRPISLLAVPSKIAERIMHYHLTNVLEKDEILIDQQYGYRQGRGTGDAIFKFVNDLYDNQDRSHVTACCFVDLKKAFDSVCHLHLLEIVSKLGLHVSVMAWIQD